MLPAKSSFARTSQPREITVHTQLPEASSRSDFGEGGYTRVLPWYGAHHCCLLASVLADWFPDGIWLFINLGNFFSVED